MRRAAAEPKADLAASGGVARSAEFISPMRARSAVPWRAAAEPKTELAA